MWGWWWGGNAPMEEYVAQQRSERAAAPAEVEAPGGGAGGESMAEYAERVRAEKAAGTAESTAERMRREAAEREEEGLVEKVEGQVDPVAMPGRTLCFNARTRADWLHGVHVRVGSSQLGAGTAPAVFGVCVCVSLLLGLVFYLAFNDAQRFPAERRLAYCSFEEAAAVAVPAYCDVGESCYNSTQQLEQVGHEEQVCTASLSFDTPGVVSAL